MKRQRNSEKEDKSTERLMPATGEESRQSIRKGAGNIISIQKMTRGRNLRWLQPLAATSGYLSGPRILPQSVPDHIGSHDLTLCLPISMTQPFRTPMTSRGNLLLPPSQPGIKWTLSSHSCCHQGKVAKDSNNEKFVRKELGVKAPSS